MHKKNDNDKLILNLFYAYTGLSQSISLGVCVIIITNMKKKYIHLDEKENNNNKLIWYI